MPITTRSRVPGTSAGAAQSTATTRTAKKDPVPTKPSRTTTKQPVPALTNGNADASDDDVPLSTVKRALKSEKPLPKAKASAVPKATARKAASSVSDETFVLPKPERAPIRGGARTIYRTQRATTGKAPVSSVDETFVITNSPPASDEESEEAPKVKSRGAKKNAPPESPVDVESVEEPSHDAPKAGVAQKKAKPVINPIKPSSRRQYKEMDVEQETSPDATRSKGGRELVSRDEIEDMLDETVKVGKKLASNSNAAKKGQKSKPGASKKAQPAPEPYESESEESPSVDSPIRNPQKKGKMKPVALSESFVDEAQDSGELSNPENQQADSEELSEPENQQADPEEMSEPEDEPEQIDPEDDPEELSEPESKPTKRNGKNKPPLIEESDSAEEPSDEEGQESEEELSEPEYKPAKRGGRKKEPAAKPVKKPARKAPAKKGVSKEDEKLLEMMNKLELDDDTSKKGKKKKAGSTAKPRGRKGKQAKEVDSEPEGTLSKYSSTESLKNVTIRGAGRSLSEDNLNSIAPAMLDGPRGRRGRIPKRNDPESDEEEAEEEVVVKKTRAPPKRRGGR